jgi:hypothetical protein
MGWVAGVAGLAGVAALASLAEVASSIHINSTVLFLFLILIFSSFILSSYHPIIFEYFIFHISYFQKIQHA